MQVLYPKAGTKVKNSDLDKNKNYKCLVLMGKWLLRNHKKKDPIQNNSQ